MSTSSTSTSQPTPLNDAFASFESDILGGDYAGLTATFSSNNGELVPVPEHLVPESMIEWGEIPSSFETLSSEDCIVRDSDGDDGCHGHGADGGDVGDSGGADSARGLTKELERMTITVLPEVGCGIDNLEVTKRSERYACDASRLESWRGPHPERDSMAVDRRSGRRLDAETIFQIDSAVDEEQDDEGAKTRPRRLRVSLSIDLPEGSSEDPAPSKLITLSVERRSSPRSTRGTVWSGLSSNSGGLDARTVANTIGRDIVYGDVFGVKRIKGGEDVWNLVDSVSNAEDEDGAVDVEKILDGGWTRAFASSDGSDDAARVPAAEVGDGGASMVTIRLPQNIMVKYGRGLPSLTDDADAWTVEVSHLGAVVADGVTRMQRRVVARSLSGVYEPAKGHGDGVDGRGGLGGIVYTVEEKDFA